MASRSYPEMHRTRVIYGESGRQCLCMAETPGPVAQLVKHTPVADVDDPDLPLPPMTVEKAPPTLPIAQSVPSPVPESTTASESN